MSRYDHLVADSDLHVFEPPDPWQRYIDPAFEHAAPAGLTASQAVWLTPSCENI